MNGIYDFAVLALIGGATVWTALHVQGKKHRARVMDLEVRLAEATLYQDQAWRWKGKDTRSIGGVVWRGTRYVILEPCGRGFTPHFVRRDSPDLELVG